MSINNSLLRFAVATLLLIVAVVSAEAGSYWQQLKVTASEIECKDNTVQPATGPVMAQPALTRARPCETQNPPAIAAQPNSAPSIAAAPLQSASSVQSPAPPSPAMPSDK